MKHLTRTAALLLALMMLFLSVASAQTVYAPGDMTPEQWQSLVENAQNELFSVDEGGVPVPTASATPTEGANHPYTDLVEATLVPGGEDLPLSMSTSGLAVLSCQTAGQWQMTLDGAWVDITGETGAQLRVDIAMLRGMTGASFRKALKDGSVSQTAVLSLVQADPSQLFATAATFALEDPAPLMSLQTGSGSPYSLATANETLTKYTVQIHYVFEDGSPAASSYVAQVGETNPNLSANVAFPTITGYEADTSAPLADGFAYTATGISISLTNISADVSIKVTYKPVKVNFHVRHYLQNVDDELYAATPVYDEAFTALTGTVLSDTYPQGATSQYYATDRPGFLPLLYNEHITIAADGSTVVPVYYVRLYSLMVFNLQGGRGVDPIYAKHGTAVGDVGTPFRDGYTFAGWSTTPDGTNPVDLPDVMPIQDTTYYAIWTPETGTTPYRVVYWLENADGPKDDPATAADEATYSVLASFTTMGDTDAQVSGAAFRDHSYILTDANYGEVKDYITFHHADENVVIAGDGSTVVNLYYRRNEYTLRFYYAMSKVERRQTRYYVVGGNSYYFGGSATARNKLDELNMLDTYMQAHSGETGQVSARPTLNLTQQELNERGYQLGTETSSTNSDYKYYYFQFSARFGADLSGRWPFGVMNNVETARSNDDHKGDWQNKPAVFSAWNGEYYVHYSQHNSNETIKGNYTQLDEQLLWDPNVANGRTSDDNRVVSYMAFWENGSDHNWNYPRLFRYYVWLPVTDNVSIPADAERKTHSGISYYQYRYYDTVDNTTENWANVQTPPGMIGFKCVSRDSGNISPNVDPEVYKSCHYVNFYYERDQHTLTFISGDETLDSRSVFYGETLSTYYLEPDHLPDSMSASSADFGGWYTTVECLPGTEFDFTGATMPASELILYARWIPHNYDVTVYATKADMNDPDATPAFVFKGVLHGDAAYTVFSDVERAYYDADTGAFKNVTNGLWDFTYWTSVDAQGNEKFFDFSVTPVTGKLVVYGNWMLNKIVPYQVYYLLDDGVDGTTYDPHDQTKWVADPLEDSNLAGFTVTVQADRDAAELYPDYRTGYFPTVTSATLELGLEENVYVFEYTPRAQLPYTVHHLSLENPGNDLGTIELNGTTYYPIAPSQTYRDNTCAVVTENYVYVERYLPDALQKQLILTVNGTDADGDLVNDENVIVFLYTRDNGRTVLKVNHHRVPYQQAPQLYHTESTILDTFPQTLNIAPLAITNYTFDPAQSVRTDESGTTSGSQALSFTLSKGGSNVSLDLYYTEDLVSLNYQVAPGCTHMGALDATFETFGGVTGTPAGAVATANAGYRFVGWYKDSACTNLVSADAAFVPTAWVSGDVFYALFVQDTADLVITKTVLDAAYTAAPADDAFTLTVTLADPNKATSCTGMLLPKGSADAPRTVFTGENGVYTFTLKDEDTLFLNDITIGSAYTVAEADHPRYTELVSAPSGTIAANGTMVMITNSYLTGTLTITKNVTGTPEDESFLFHVTGPDGYNGYVAINGSGSKTLSNLPLGTYTVRELDWAYRYTGAAPQTAVLDQNALAGQVTFVNTEKPEKWLHDEASNHNDFSQSK